MTPSKLEKIPSDSEFRQRLSICITLPLISVVLLAGVMAWQINRLPSATDRMQASNDVISAARHIEKLAADLETGSRAYLITGSRGFLEPYSRARPAIDPVLSRLQALVSGNPSQTQKAEKLRGLINAWIDFSRRAIELRSRTATPGAFTVTTVPSSAAALAIAEERRRMEPVRALISSIIRSQENERSLEDQDEALRNRLALGLGIGLAFALGISMALVFGGQLRSLWQLLQEELRRSRGETAEREGTIRELQQELSRTRAQEEFFRHIVQEASGYSLLKVNSQGSILSWNYGAERLHGFGRGEAVGQDFSILFGPKAVETGRPGRILQIAARKGRYAEEGWRARKGGSFFWAETIVNAVHDDFGEMDGFSVLVRDLSARKLADKEQALMFSKVEEAIRARDQFLSIASHEIKVPTVALSRQIQGLLLQQHGASSTLKPVLEGFKRQTDRLQRMADEMIDLSRSHTGRLAYNFRQTHLGELIRNVIDQVSDQAAASGSSIELEGNTSATGNWDPLRVEQILLQLLSNAIRFGHGKPITVNSTIQANRIVVSVQDQGPGIEKQRLGRIFERFSSRSSELTEGEAGLGVGLYLARQIAEGHGGHLWVESIPNAGATFHLELPLRPAMDAAATGLTTAGIGKATASAPDKAQLSDAT